MPISPTAQCGDAFARPEDNGRTVIPAVDRIARVAGKAFVLRLERFAIDGWFRVADLRVVDAGCDGLRPAAAGSNPVAQLDAAIDELDQFVAVLVAPGIVPGFVVIIVIAIVVVAPGPPTPAVAVVVVLAGPGLVHVGQREKYFAVEPPSHLLKRCSARRIGVLEPVPGEPALRVLMVEQIDETVGRLTIAVVAPAVRQGSLEEVAHEPAQNVHPRLGGSGCHRASFRDQVAGQHDAVTLLDRTDFVTAIGVERDQRELLVGTADPPFLVVMLDHKAAARELRRQAHDQRADHVVRLFRVLVRDEELAGRVDEQIVQLRPEPARLRQPQLAADLLKRRAKRFLPSALIDGDAAFGNLPGIADFRVEAGLILEPVAGWPGGRAELASRGSRDRQPDAAHAP